MATLNISDLSVGDWVEIDHEDFGWQPAQINVCGDLGIGAYFKDIDPEEEYDCTLSQARPIPITAEILEKNGFGKKTFTQDQLFRIVEPNGNMPFIGYRWDSRRVIIERDNDYMLRVKAEYIHQLQHALRLAGVDKEINL